MKMCAIFFALCLLAACSSAPVTACPVLVDYDDRFNTQLADALDGLQADNPIVRAIRDYISLRDQVRACLEAV